MTLNEQTGQGSGGALESCLGKLQTGLVALLFTDIVGSTALKQQLGDWVGAGVIEQHHQLVCLGWPL
jgi:class 3 adenylate cyclase